MKMSAEHFTRLEHAVLGVCRTIISPAEYKQQNPTFSKKRVRWDFVWFVSRDVRRPLIDEIYAAGLNDEHIDTALRRIFKD